VGPRGANRAFRFFVARRDGNDRMVFAPGQGSRRANIEGPTAELGPVPAPEAAVDQGRNGRTGRARRRGLAAPCRRPRPREDSSALRRPPASLIAAERRRSAISVRATPADEYSSVGQSFPSKPEAQPPSGYRWRRWSSSAWGSPPWRSRSAIVHDGRGALSSKSAAS